MKFLTLGEGVTLPVDAVTQTFLIVGKRGSGKSNTAARFVEQLHRAKLPFVVLDPVDTWWGLKAGRDGGPGLDNVYVFGGRKADLPLEPGAGALLADVLCTHRVSMVLSVKHLSGRARSAFMVAFAMTLFQKWAGGPLHLVLEEAHELAPQMAARGGQGEDNEAAMLGAFKRLWKLGRAAGIGGTAVTQRPASLSKDITTQSEILIAHRTIGPQDVAAIGEWVKYHGAHPQLLKDLPSLPTGEAFLWAPEFPEGQPLGLQLLDAERIGVGHAEQLAKLKPEDQERAIDPGDDKQFGRAGDPGGLWQSMGRTLYDADEDAEEKATADPYAGLKPRTVKELEAWIARHVRFDVTHAAETAPLDFGQTAIQVEAAQAQPGRGKKVIAITQDYRIDDDVKDASERVYGIQSWKRADGQDDKTCDHSVLGVVTVGPGYGTAFPVCIARDRCQVHWAKEIKEREKNAKLRAKGQGAKADAKEKKATETYEQKWKREAAERKAREQAWAALWKLLQPEVVRQVKAVTALTPALATHLEKNAYDMGIDPRACKQHGLQTWWKALPAALLLSEVVHGEDCDTWADFVKSYGGLVDLKPLQAIRDQHEASLQAKSDSVPSTKASTKKAAKPTKAKKKAR